VVYAYTLNFIWIGVLLPVRFTTLFPESKSFLHSNAFMAKSGTQTLTFKSLTDRQTDKKLNVFGRPGGG